MVGSNTGKVQFNVYLPADLVRALKHHAIDEGVSLSSLVERVMSTYLSGDETAPTERPAP